MAMTDQRRLLITVLACATIAAVALPPVGEQSQWKTYLRSQWRYQRARRMQEQVGQLQERRHLLAQRDTLLRSSVVLSPGEVRLQVRGDAPPAIVERVRNVVDAARARIGFANGIPTLITVIVESGKSAEDFRRQYGASTLVQYIPPHLVDGTTCHVVLRIHREATEQRLNRAVTPQGVMGPCGFMSVFGRPSVPIEHWLRSRGWDLAGAPRFPANPAAQPGTIRGDADRDSLAKLFSTNYELTTTRACRAGNIDACRSAVMGPGRRTDDVYYRFEDRFREPAAGFADDYFLSDLVVEFGRERFKSFWTSSEKPEAAFEKTFGLPVGEWTNRWMRYRYDPESRGPLVPVSSVFLALLSVTVVLAVAVALEKRQVG